MVEQKEIKKPIVSANSFGVSAAIWENKNKAGNEYKSISLNASTKQKDGSYKNRTIFFPSDLENLITTLTTLKKQAEEQGIKTKFETKN